ncbi:MAG TPA: hypothetical protein VN611_15970 [Patescibacteria group bacterium]|nr:hypothetical protein [Patescibacteria group bacterium]
MFGFAEQSIMQWGMISLMFFLFGIFFLCRVLPIAATIKQSAQQRHHTK